MSGIKHYPSRDEKRYQNVISTNSNIALTSSNASSIYYCTNTGVIYISITAAESDALPIGSQFDFIRSNSNVAFSSAPGGITFSSSSGATPQIRVTGGACSFIKTTSTNWVVVGDITT
jgi:hypothetical protein